MDTFSRILVSGISYNDINGDMAVWRFTTNGLLDSSFGDGDGILTFDSGDLDTGYSIALDSSGRMLVTGSSYIGNNRNLAIWRFK